MGDKCKWLVLVPTEKERTLLAAPFQAFPNTEIELCGFGPITAAARASQLIAAKSPERILLVGIAGACSSGLTVGNAYQFSSVVCHGVGIGHGEKHIDAEAAGWKLLDSDSVEIDPEIQLQVVGELVSSLRSQLRTVCSAPADKTEAGWLNEVYPASVAEDMEAYGVALAAQLAAIPLHVVRGISNQVGDRNHAGWKIDEALNSAAELALNVLRSPL